MTLRGLVILTADRTRMVTRAGLTLECDGTLHRRFTVANHIQDGAALAKAVKAASSFPRSFLKLRARAPTSPVPSTSAVPRSAPQMQVDECRS